MIEKAQQLCEDNNARVEDHFVEYNEMVEVRSGARRSLSSYQLSRYACLLIAMNFNGKKPQALEYFSGKQEVSKALICMKIPTLFSFPTQRATYACNCFF